MKKLCVILLAISIFLTQGSMSVFAGVFETRNYEDTNPVGNNFYVWGDYTYYVSQEEYAIIVEYNGTEEHVEIPSVIEEFPVKIISDRVFENNEYLKSVIVPEGVEGIHNYAFYNCKELEEVTLPTTLVEAGVGDYAFAECGKLKKINIPDHIKYINNGTFQGCSSLESIELPSELTFLFADAFAGCTALTEVALPKTLCYLEGGAFENCTGLTTVSGPTYIDWGDSANGSAFKGCINLRNINLGTSKSKLPGFLFYDADWMTKYEVPENITTLGDYMLAECDALTEVIISPTVTDIGEGVFQNSPNVVIYGESGTAAEDYAIENNIPFVNLGVKIASITLDKTEALMDLKSSLQLNATVLPEEYKNNIIWTSSDESIAIVSKNGLVETMDVAGNVEITARAGEHTATCTITAYRMVKDIGMSTEIMHVGETRELQVVIYPADAYNKKLDFTSSDPSIVSVDQNGIVTAHEIGEVIIFATATDGSGVSHFCTVVVKEDNPLNGLVFNDDGTAVFYLDGVINDGFTGIYLEGDDGWMVEQGYVTLTYNGLGIGNSNFYYVVNSKVDWSYNGLHPYKGVYYYLEDGVSNWNYTGLTYYGNTWYYVKNGVWDWNYTGLTEYDGTWYYVRDGVLDWSYTGLTEYHDAWYYVCDGVLDWSYTGLTLYYDTWYYISGGILDWNYTGLTLYYDTWYYISGGILDWNYAGLTLYYDTWYYVNNGVLDWDYTGLTYYYDTWYYVSGGVLDWSYTGLTCYYDVWYYVNGGVLDWSYTGLTLYYDTWYYVNGGVLDWLYTGLTCYYDTWYYVNGGILDWGYTGLTPYNGNWYYVNGGVLDWSYKGYVPYNGSNYYVYNGVVMDVATESATGVPYYTDTYFWGKWDTPMGHEDGIVRGKQTYVNEKFHTSIKLPDGAWRWMEGSNYRDSSPEEDYVILASFTAPYEEGYKSMSVRAYGEKYWGGDTSSAVAFMLSSKEFEARPYTSFSDIQKVNIGGNEYFYRYEYFDWEEANRHSVDLSLYRKCDGFVLEYSISHTRDNGRESVAPTMEDVKQFLQY